jgi:flagellar biosynthetic protein FliR
MQLSLPIVAALLITNVALGILTRAAPQLNLFGIGFPITLGVGLTVIGMTLPYLSGPLQNLFLDGLETGRSLPRTWAAKTPPPVAAPAPLAPARN